jgi:aryl-alcohol dehydrogenase-like predicted oxidoreductase
MNYRIFGNTGVSVSEIGLGTWQMGGPTLIGSRQIGWGEVDDNTSLKVLDAAVDNGITFIDTADAYGGGHSETLVGKAYKDKRDKVFISTKYGNHEDEQGNWVKDFSPEYTRKALEASLKRLQTDYVDFLHLHSPGPSWRLEDDTVEMLEKLKSEGKLRFYGFSIMPPRAAQPDFWPSEQGKYILDENKGFDFFQVVYNIFTRGVEKDFFPECEKKGAAVIARVPLASGFLSGKFTKETRFPETDHRHFSYPVEKIEELVDKVEKLRFLEIPGKRTLVQAALQFCLANSAVSTVIPGARTPDQVIANAAASDVPSLTDEELKKIDEITQ